MRRKRQPQLTQAEALEYMADMCSTFHLSSFEMKGCGCLSGEFLGVLKEILCKRHERKIPRDCCEYARRLTKECSEMYRFSRGVETEEIDSNKRLRMAHTCGA